MDPEVVTLQPRSRTEHAALTALLDLGDMLASSAIDVKDTRVIGAHMVSLHVARHDLDQAHTRMTADTDFGLDLVTLRQLDPIEHFARSNYELRGGHRFHRPLEDEAEAVIDVLVPSYSGGPGKNRAIGGLVTYKTPGLAELLRRDPLRLDVHVELPDGSRRNALVATTDELGALLCKVLAWEDRSRKREADKDAFDVWRCLEICKRANVRPDDWPEAFESTGWKHIIRRDFAERGGRGCEALAKYLRSNPGPDSAKAVTRTTALLGDVVGRR